jgi:acetyltransferase-like isoleucine patch superfamily enzyme
MQSDSIKMYPNVFLGEGTVVDPFVILGKPPKDSKAGEIPLRIGNDGVLRSHTVVYAGATIGNRFQSGHHVLIREGTSIGDDCSVGSNSVVEFNVNIGNGVRLHSNVFVPEYSVLGDGCWIGPNAVLTNAKYPASPRAKETLEGVKIEQDAVVGANATILPGVVIGAGSLIGAGAVVTRNVLPGSVVLGNPGRVIREVHALGHEDSGEPVYPRAKELQVI